MCVPESPRREPEETMVARRLLLVGEGNFSFTASLIDTLDPGVRVTATCLQHPADLEGDPVTQENLQRLRQRGTGSHPSARPGPESGVWLALGMRVRLLGALTGKCSAGLVCSFGFVRVTDLKSAFWSIFHPIELALPGVEVRFGVDCTQLARALQAHERDFDRIYFNFPHCGRKAGVAKNRKLLAMFFQR